jgi:hypothetical protein
MLGFLIVLHAMWGLHTERANLSHCTHTISHLCWKLNMPIKKKCCLSTIPLAWIMLHCPLLPLHLNYTLLESVYVTNTFPQSLSCIPEDGSSVFLYNVDICIQNYMMFTQKIFWTATAMRPQNLHCFCQYSEYPVLCVPLWMQRLSV